MPIFAKVNASMPWNDKVADLSDGEFRAFVKLICAAKQRESGVFTEPALLDVLGVHAKHAKGLLKARLVDEIGVRKYRLHDFDEHQGPIDTTAARRQAEWRERQKKPHTEHESASSPQVDNGVDNGADNVMDNALRHAVTPTGQSRAEQSRDSTKKHGAPRAREPEASDDVPAEELELTALVDALIMANVWQRPTKRMIGFLANLIREHGQKAVEEQAALLVKGTVPDDFLGSLAEALRQAAVSRTIRSERARLEAEARRQEREDERIAELRSQPGAEETAAERRKAIADFAQGLSSPPTPRPRGQQQEGRSA